MSESRRGVIALRIVLVYSKNKAAAAAESALLLQLKLSMIRARSKFSSELASSPSVRNYEDSSVRPF